MRKLLCWLAVLALLPFGGMGFARAAESRFYVRAVKDGVLLYKNATDLPSDQLFALAKGYFALASDYDETFYRITYQTSENGYVPIFGFVKKSEVVLYPDGAPSPVYPDFSATALFNNTYLYESAGGGKLCVLVKNQRAKCYGFLTRGEDTFVYATYGDFFGYILCSNLEITDIPEHPIPLPKEPDPVGPGQDEDPPAQKDDKLQILLILAIVIPSLVIIYVMLRPKKKKF